MAGLAGVHVNGIKRLERMDRRLGVEAPFIANDFGAELTLTAERLPCDENGRCRMHGRRALRMATGTLGRWELLRESERGA